MTTVLFEIPPPLDELDRARRRAKLPQADNGPEASDAAWKSACEPWRARAGELTRWAWHRAVNRTDVWGGYLPLKYRTDKGPAVTKPKKEDRGKTLLNEGVIAKHFFCDGESDVIGLHAISQDNGCLWGAVECDRHDEARGQPSPEQIFEFARSIYVELVNAGFRPLFTDSNGRGGMHLRVFFSSPVESGPLYRWLHHLSRGYADFGLGKRPETFPKQEGLDEIRKFGNWLRLPGRHHTRRQLSRVWNGSTWLDGADAVAAILALSGDDPALMPFIPAAVQPSQKRHSPATHNGQLDNVIIRARSYLNTIEPAVARQRGHDATYRAAAKLVQGFDLTPKQALPLLAEWNQACLPPWEETDLLKKLRDADREPGRRGYILENSNSVTSGSKTAGVGGEAVAESFKLERLTSAELDAGDFTQAYLVDGILPAGQCGVIGGRFKTLKTTTAADLAISLGSGHRFLSEFAVPEPAPVIMLSCESGLPAIQNMARRICRAKGIGLSDLANVHWSSSLIQLTNDGHLSALADFVRDVDAKLLVIDPTYLVAGAVADSATNVYAMGGFFWRLSGLSQATGASIVLVHHTKKSRGGEVERFGPPELEELAMAGVCEWARFWVLLGRRAEFDEERGLHRLWLVAGGSAGHAGTYGIDACEGRQGDDGGRRWEVAVSAASEIRQAKEQNKEARKQAAGDAKLESDRKLIVGVMVKFPNGETQRAIRDRTPMADKRFPKVWATLLDDGIVIEGNEIKKGNGRTYQTFKLRPDSDV